MIIPIILDKSTFQLLSFSEIKRLSYYYRHNISPILIEELRGDLSKDFSTGKSSTDRVKDFANKLSYCNTIINRPYLQLVKEDLCGNRIQMDSRPVPFMERIILPNGQIGAKIIQTPYDKLIEEWKEGHFSEDDIIRSDEWRRTTTHPNYLKSIIEQLPELKLRSLEDINERVTNLLLQANEQETILRILFDIYDHIRPPQQVEIFSRWAINGRPLIKDFAPYAFYCFKVFLLFRYCLMSKIIGERPTNYIDLQYLYYLPFCYIFSSNDNLHKKLVPFLLFPFQKFIVGEHLKNDIKNIVGHLNELDVNLRKEFISTPPKIDSSLTYKYWHEYQNFIPNNT